MASSKKTQRKVYAEITENGVRTTFKKYDELVDKLTSSKYQRDNWWPTPYEVEHYIIPNFDLCYEFVVWILETGPDPVTEEDKAVKKMLNDLLIEKVEFYDDPEEEAEEQKEKKE